MNTGLVVLKMVLMPDSTRWPSFLKSGPRWSITGMAIAFRMRSGTGVGPGILQEVPAGAARLVRHQVVSVAREAYLKAGLWRAANAPARCHTLS